MFKRARKTRKSLVLDASVALAWCFEDKASDSIDALLRTLTTFDCLAPPFWRLEIGNVLITTERHKRCTPTDTETWLRLLKILAIRIDDAAPTSARLDAIRLPRAQKLFLYDAC